MMIKPCSFCIPNNAILLGKNKISAYKLGCIKENKESGTLPIIPGFGRPPTLERILFASII